MRGARSVMPIKEVIQKGRPIFALQFNADEVFDFMNQIQQRGFQFTYDVEKPDYIIVMDGSGRKSILLQGWWLIMSDNVSEVLDNDRIWYHFEER
jgi:hypothetical protein